MIVDRFQRGVLGLPGRWRHRRADRRRLEGYKALTQGMVAVAAGDVQEARRHARSADRLLDDKPLTRLLAAQTAQLSGEDGAARTYFEAMVDDPSAAFLGVRGLLMQALKSGDREEALVLCERAFELRPDTPWVLTELLDLQVEFERWEEALATLHRIERAKLLTPEEVQAKRARILLSQARDSHAVEHRAEAIKLTQKAIKADPELDEAAALGARLLNDTGKVKRAARMVEDAWERAPSQRLARAYRDLAPKGTTELGQVKRFERLLSLNPDHPESHLALAEAALDADLWGEARRHLKAAGSEGDNPSPRLCRLMARLEESEHGDLELAHHWLARAAEASEAAETVLLPEETRIHDAF